MKYLPRLLRWARRAAKILAGLCVLVVLLVGGLAFTTPGRALVLGFVVRSVNDSIPGHLDAAELSALGPGAIEVQRLEVFDPENRRVLELARVRVGLNLWELVRGRIVLPSIHVDDGFVDLLDVEKKRRGLVAAFVDTDAPQKPPSGPPPHVQIDEIVVTKVDVRRVSVPRVGTIDARGLALRGAFELNGEMAARIDELSARLARENEQLGELRHFSADVAPPGGPSSLAVDATVMGSKMTVRARARRPDLQGRFNGDAHVELAVENVTAAGLSRLLNDSSLKDAFQGALGLTVRADGPVRELPLDVQLDSAGGVIGLQAQVHEFESVELHVAAKAFTPHRLVRGAPRRRLDVEWHGRAGRKEDHTEVAIELAKTTIDGILAPRVRATGNVSGTSVNALDLRVEDGRSVVTAQGAVGFDGSATLQTDADLQADSIRKIARILGDAPPDADGRVQAHLSVRYPREGSASVKGTLAVQDVELSDIEVERLDARVDLSGVVPYLSGSVEAKISRARIGKERINDVVIEVRGGPKEYELSVSGDVDAVHTVVEANVAPANQSVALRGHGRGAYKGRAWQFRIAPTRVQYSGSVDTEGIVIAAAGQSIKAIGRFAESNSDFRLEAEGVELHELSALLETSPRFFGTADVRANVRGTPRRPTVALDLTLNDFRAGKSPGIDTQLTGHLDTAAGTLALEAAIGSHVRTKGITEQAFAMEVRAHGEFPTDRPWLDALLHPEHRFEANLRVDRLDSTYVQEWIPETILPVAGSVQAEFSMTGSIAAPVFSEKATSELLVVGSREPLKVIQDLSYAQGRFDAALLVTDARGKLFDASAEMDLASHPDLVTLVRRAPEAPAAATWRLEAALVERELDKLPIAEALSDVPAARIRAAMELEHQPRSEPEGTAIVSIVPELDSKWSDRCQKGGVSLDAIAGLKQGEARAEIVGRTAKRAELLRVGVDAKLRLAPALEGGEPQWQVISARLGADDLELGELPFICNRARGRVTATAEIRDPFGSSPQAGARVRVRGLDLGSESSVSLELDADATSSRANATLSITPEGEAAGRTEARARIPVLWKDGRFSVSKNEPIDVRATLRHLPIAPFVPREGPISYASGALSGSVSGFGTLARPRMHGKIDLEEIAFTATDLAQPVRQVGGQIEFTQALITFRNITAHDKDGELRVNGRMNLGGSDRIDADVRVEAEDFPIRQHGQVVATTDADARVRASVAPKKTNISIVLTNVSTWLETGEIRRGIQLERHPDIVVDGVAPSGPDERPVVRKDERASGPVRGPSTKAKVSETPSVTELTLDASERFWLKRDDFAVKLTAHLKTRIGGEEVRIEGAIDVDRGYLQLLGRVFDIERGSKIEFIGSAKPDPALKITAVHVNRRSGDEIKVVIGGRGSAPKLTFLVNRREVTAGDAFLAIYGSEKSNDDPDDADQQAKRFVGGLTAGLLASSARRELGAAAPILMVDPGDEAGEGRVRAGFELDSLLPHWLRALVTGMYLEGIVARESDGEASRGGAKTQGGALLELYFPKGYFTSGQYGPGAIWSVDFGWQL